LIGSLWNFGDAPIQLRGFPAKTVECTLPAWGRDSVTSTGVRKIYTQSLGGAIDLARFFDPGRAESVNSQKMRFPDLSLV
jgi:hypothetical protein